MNDDPALTYEAHLSVESALLWRLAVCGRLVRTMADGSLTDIGAQALAVLYRLDEEDGISQAELARRQRIDPPTMCRMIDRLETARLVSRTPDPLDRRSVRVMLTDKGREVTDHHIESLEELERRAFNALSADERGTLNRLLGRVLATLPGPGSTTQ